MKVLLFGIAVMTLISVSLLPVHAQTTWTFFMWGGFGAWQDSDIVGVVTADEDTFTLIEYKKNADGKYRVDGATMVGTYNPDGTFSGTYTLADGSWTFMQGTLLADTWTMTDSEGTEYSGSYTYIG